MLNNNICDICNSENIDTIFRYNNTLYYTKCLCCGFIKKNPNIVTIDYSIEYHTKEKLYYSKSLANNYFKRLAKKINPNQYCLEIGGSFGFFSKYLQEYKQCIVRNIEPSIFAASYANSQNIRTFNNIYDLDIKLFDYIFLFHVVEHIKAADIKNFINNAMALLKQGGVCYIFTPNANSFSLKLLGKYYTWLAPDEHTNFLSSNSLNYLVDNNEITLSILEEIPAFIHYPMPSFLSFIRKKLFKHKVNDFIELSENTNVKPKLKKIKLILVLKNIFSIFVKLERLLFYPIYRFYNMFSSHKDELVIELKNVKNNLKIK